MFFKDGKYKVVKISEKQFVGKDIEYVAVYKRNDQRTIFNASYILEGASMLQSCLLVRSLFLGYSNAVLFKNTADTL